MTVAELIAQLQNMPMDAPVALKDDEGDFVDATEVEEIQMTRRCVDPRWAWYERPRESDAVENKTTVVTLV